MAKRRFIHSCESNQKKNEKINQYYDSDTELYIAKPNDNNENIMTIDMFKKFRQTIKLKNQKKFKTKKDLKKSSKQIAPKIELNSFEETRNSLDDINTNLPIPKNTVENKSKINARRLLTKTYNTKINKSLSKKNVIYHSKLTKLKLNIENKDGDQKILRTNTLDKNKKKENTFSFIRMLTNKFLDEENNNSFLEQIDETEIQSFQYFEKNEKCGICLDEIKDKFTLLCGDFFCRECIINLIEEGIKNITLFDKIRCPVCHESINENTIKFLLRSENLDLLNKYNKILTRIEGLKNKNLIPCPHPDCEGFAPKEKVVNGALICQNGHFFCKKCLEEIPHKSRSRQNITHECGKKYGETIKFLEKSKDIKKCPQCKSWVQRVPGGCNYFECNNIWCKYIFCWICGKKYEPSHYKNPLSTCFGLSQSDYKGKMIKSIRMRRIRCILIAFLLILIILPIICIFFSLFSIISFVLYFHFDGKELRGVTIHSKPAGKAFYLFYFLAIVCISIGLIPFGYMCLIILLLSIPILIIISKIKKKKGNDF